jgi:F-type H+-transporting ATPase subunit delta
MKEVVISTAAKRYARAMLEVTIRHRNFSIVLEELELFQQQLKIVPLLEKLFINPAVSAETKRKVLVALGTKLGLAEITINFLKTLIHRDRLNILEQVVVSAEQQFLEKQGILVVQVTSPKKLDAEQERRLGEKLEKFTGKRVQLENKVDPSLIGGVITRIGTTLYDGSVQAQLQQLKARIQEE